MMAKLQTMCTGWV